MSDIITISDHIGRTVVGEVVENAETTLTLSNPVIIHAQPNPENGQLQVQSFPYIFMEFIADRETNNWTFNKDNIVISNVTLDPRIIQQYHNINNPQPPAQQAPAEEPETIKLFDE